MMSRRDLPRVQWHYEQLHRANPYLPHDELWRQATMAAISGAGPTDQELWGFQHRVGVAPEKVRTAPQARRIKALAAAGFLLVVIATGLATVQFVLLSEPDSFDADPWPFWAGAFLLGSASLAVLMIAKTAVDRSAGLDTTRRLIKIGLGIAIVGTIEVALPIFALLGAASEGL